MQRIQFSSDLDVPLAEIDFEELSEFMLDRGAVPDAKGIHMLRVSGLWTPTGTCLMLYPDASRTALRVSMPDITSAFCKLIPDVWFTSAYEIIAKATYRQSYGL